MNSAKLGANKDRQSTSRTRIMQRIHNLGAHNIPTKHKNTYNSHGARRSPAPTQQQLKDPKAPRHNQTDHDQGAHNMPTKHKYTYNGHGARRPPALTQQTENRQTGKQNTCICTTARGQTGPPHQPNNRQRARRPPATSKQTTNRQNKTQTKHTQKNKTARGSAAPPHQSIYTEQTHKTMAKTLQTAPLRDGTGHTKCPINPGGSRSPAAHPWRGVG